MDMRKYVLSLMGASVAAGVFPTFHQAFATDAAEGAGSDCGLAGNAGNAADRRQPAAGQVPAVRSRKPITNDIAWRPLAT